MADGKNRFKIGNTTINLGEIGKICKFNTEPIDFCRFHMTPPDFCRFYITPPNTCHFHLTPPNTCHFHLTPPNCPTRSIWMEECHGGTLPFDWDHITPKLKLEDIVGLKEQLMEELKVLEAHEIAFQERETPTTLEEINVVEDNLVNSLAEVQKLKEELSRKKQN